MRNVYIVACSHRGPVFIGDDKSTSVNIPQITTAPIYAESCGELSIDEVIQATRKFLPEPFANGWIKADMQAAIDALKSAKKAMSAQDVSSITG